MAVATKRAPVKKKVAAPPALAEGMYVIAIDDVRPAVDNLRAELGDLTDLTESIRQYGILEPIVIDTEGIVVAGNRRLAAAIAAGLAVVPVVCRQISELDRQTFMLAENLQRSDLSPVEEGTGYQRLLDLGLLDDDHVAERVGMRVQRVKERRRLLALPMKAQIAMRDGSLTIAHALQLADLAQRDSERAEKICKRVRRWSDIGWYVNTELTELKEQSARDKARKGLPKGTKVIHGNWDGHIPAESAAGEDGWTATGKFAGMMRVVSSPDDIEVRRGLAVVIPPAKHRELPCRAVCITRGGKVVEFCSAPGTHQLPADSGKTVKKPKAKPAADYWDADIRVDDRVAAMRRLLDSPIEVAKLIVPAMEFLINEPGELRWIDAADFAGAPTTGAGGSWQGNLAAWCALDLDAAAPAANLTRLIAAARLMELEDELFDCMNPWSADDGKGPAEYFDLLVAHGYELSDVEKNLMAAAAEKASGCDETGEQPIPGRIEPPQASA